MELSFSVPDSVGQHLHGHWADLSRRELEAVVLEAYREGALTEAEVQQTLCFDSEWSLQQVDTILELTGSIGQRSQVLERLAVLAPTMPELAFRC